MSCLPRAAAPSIAAALSPANRHVLVIAHRGVFDRAPENSLAALERAVTVGADMMEIDTQSSAGGTLVVIHDNTVDRTTTGTGGVSTLDDSALAALHLLQGEGGAEAAPTAEHLPRLAEMLEAARGRILLNIDTKYARDLPAVGRLVLDMGMADDVLLKAEVDPFAVRQAVEDLAFFGRVPFMPIFKLRRRDAEAQVRAVSRLCPGMIESHFDSLQALDEARPAREAAAIRHWANSLDCSHSLDFNDTRAMSDPDNVWGVLLDAGVGAIQTDQAEALIRWLGKRHVSATR